LAIRRTLYQKALFFLFWQSVFVQPFFFVNLLFYGGDTNMKIWSRHQRERDESNPSLTTVDSSLSQLLSLALAYCYYLLFIYTAIIIWSQSNLNWSHLMSLPYSTLSTGRKL
jgi:hypothetical protein